jgi:hypothetical protein
LILAHQERLNSRGPFQQRQARPEAEHHQRGAEGIRVHRRRRHHGDRGQFRRRYAPPRAAAALSQKASVDSSERSGRIAPAVEAGILDPLETTLSALRRAVSAATTMLTVSTAIVSPREPGLAGERPDVSACYE